MKAVYIVNDIRVAKILVDPMRRAILDLLRQRPMTQTQLANELGLTGASLNYHIKKLRSNKLVIVAKKEVEEHSIMQIFFSSIAYLFVYDLDSFPKNIARYFYPITLERARSVVSMCILKERGYHIEQTSDATNTLSELLAHVLVKVSKNYVQKEVGFGSEEIVYEIYIKAINSFIRQYPIEIRDR
ncbi:MAG TPA: helix-turn-helix domain-containing protein [Nitrososphaeraceae archaeon]|jgi:DNA-binding transcriptional ArsR family regulator|nr:helix-turn-helix domain-containing protein [Nitrososphaeraceae archaeon]